MPTNVKGCIFNFRTSFFATYIYMYTRVVCLKRAGVLSLRLGGECNSWAKYLFFFAVFQMHRPQDFCGVRCEDNRRDEGQRHPRGFEPHPAGPAGGGDPQEAPGTSVHHTTGRVVPGLLTITAFSP